MNKRGYEFSFVWIFTILAGAFIIFLAIYFSFQLIGQSKLREETIAAKQIGVLLSAVETNLEQAQSATITVKKETILFNSCDSDGEFGKQKISTSIKFPLARNRLTEETGLNVSFRNKYFFSEKAIKGEKNFYVVSRPFKYPFKIADLIIIWPDTKKYCFKEDQQTPGDLVREIRDLGLGRKNILVQSNCPAETIEVCFSGNCDIKVDLNAGKVTKNGKTVYFRESFDSGQYSLLYAAIISDPEIYECQIKRLAKRATKLAKLYENKISILENGLNSGGCLIGEEVKNSLSHYKNKMLSVSNSTKFREVVHEALDVYQKNENLICKIF